MKIAFRSQEIESIIRKDNGETLPLFGTGAGKDHAVFRSREAAAATRFHRSCSAISYTRCAGRGRQPLLRTSRIRFPVHPPGHIHQYTAWNDPAGWIDTDPATGQELFPDPGEDVYEEDQGTAHGAHDGDQVQEKEIFEIYLNEIYLGQKGSVSINGVGEAAFFYFGKPVENLSLAEAATIAGLVKSPGLYSPYVSETKCREQRNKVLHDMEKLGHITQKQMDGAATEPVKTVGFTAYGKKAPYFVDYVSKQLPALYSPKFLSSQGLSIYTTVDTQVQEAAENALERGLARLEKTYPSLRRSNSERKLQGAIIVMQPKTGYILAMVGGRDYSTTQFNRATQARRQPGSAIKPFVYVTGLDQFTPATVLSNEQKTYEVNGESWKPHGKSSDSGKGIRMRDALARSDNLATVDLAMKIGLDKIVDTVKAFQFSTPVKPQLSLALGAYEVIPLELARAYCTFASDGVEPYPLSLKTLVDENGNVLEQRHMIIQNIISPAKAYVMSDMLRSVVTEGTAKSAKNMGITFPVAGKTGTTNDYRDAWFVGYTPDLLVLVWVGFDNGESVSAEGAVAALPHLGGPCKSHTAVRLG